MAVILPLDFRDPGWHAFFMKEKPRLERRADTAEKLEKLANGLIQSLDKIPSYSGKARFMDKVISLQHTAHSLAWDLRRDAEEVKGITAPTRTLRK